MTGTRHSLLSPPERATFFMWISGLLAASANALAATPSTPEDCRNLAAPEARLACYDALFPPARSASNVDEFGLSASQRLARRGEAPGGTDEAIEARITAVAELSDGDRIVTLDSGAIWRVTEAAPPGSLREGRQVRIRPAALGTFLMTPQGGRAVRARRVR